MVKTCCICKSRSGVNPGVSFHSIPKNKEVRTKWYLALGEKMKKYSTVCSLHFDKKDIWYKPVGDTVKRFLQPTAVPAFLKVKSESENLLNESSVLDTSVSQKSISLQKNVCDESASSITNRDENSNNSQIPCICIEDDEGPNVQNALDVENNNCTKLSVSSYGELAANKEKCHIKAEEPEVILLCDNSITETPVLKRTPSNSFRSIKRLFNPPCIGDLTREDFTSDVSRRIVQKYVKRSMRIQKSLIRKNKRLRKEVERLQLSLDYSKKNLSSSNGASNTLVVSS